MDDSHKNFSGPIAQKAIVVQDGKVLLTKGKGDGDTWEIPGGRLHEGEDPREGLRRELREELGVEFVIGPIVYTEQFVHMRSQTNHLLLAYKVTMVSPGEAFAPDATEVEELKWIEKTQLYEQRIYENCLHALEAYFKVQ